MKKFLVLSLCVVLTGGALVGCSNETEKDVTLETTQESSLEKEDIKNNKEITSIKIEDIDLKSLTEIKFADFTNLDEIVTAAQEHNNRLVATSKKIGDTFENFSIGEYKKGAINSEKNFVVDFTNKDEKSSLKTIATEFAVSTTDKNCVSKTIIHFTAKKDRGLIVTDEEIAVIKTLIPELENEDIKNNIDDLVKKSLDEPKENGYNYDFKVDEPKALFLETEPANENADDLVIKLVYWSDYNYV